MAIRLYDYARHECTQTLSVGRVNMWKYGTHLLVFCIRRARADASPERKRAERRGRGTVDSRVPRRQHLGDGVQEGRVRSDHQLVVDLMLAKVIGGAKVIGHVRESYW